MRLRRRRGSLPTDVLDRAGLRRGERVLAATGTADGAWLLGTRDALVVVAEEGPLEQRRDTPEPVRIPWEQVESADWDRDGERLRISEVGEYGVVRPVHVFTVPDPGALLPMVRERVTASVVLQRRVAVEGRRGFSVIARRAPRGTGALSWAFELDAGVDPDDPVVRDLAEGALRAAQEELGAGEDPTGAIWS